MHTIIPQLFVVGLTSFLYSQYRLYRSGKPWQNGPVHFGKLHLPVLALMSSGDVIFSLLSHWMAAPALLTGIAITLVLDR